MRVVHVITRLIVGGAQENTVSSVLGLRDRHGWDALLISGPTEGPEGDLTHLFQDHPDVLLDCPDLIRPVRPLRDWRAWIQLGKLFRQLKPTIVHTHSGKAGILGRWAARRAKVPLVIHSIHGPSFGDFQGAVANRVFKTAERMACHWTDHFITVAEAMRDQYLAAGIGQLENYTRIYSGFDLKPYLTLQRPSPRRQELGLQEGDFVVGTLARLFPLKGHAELLEALPGLLKEIPNLHLLWVGDGILHDSLEQRARELKVRDRIHFTGLVPPHEVPGMLGAMDALVHLSFREGLPRALPQAMAAGLPVISYALDGAPEVCRDGDTGLLIPPRDPEALRQALRRLALEPETRQRLAQAGQAFVRENFSVERLIDAQHDLYRQLLDPMRR